MKIDWDAIKPIPGFDAVRMKHEIQARIYEETKNMTPEEIRERRRKISEDFGKEIAERRQRIAAQEGCDAD